MLDKGEKGVMHNINVNLIQSHVAGKGKEVGAGPSLIGEPNIGNPNNYYVGPSHFKRAEKRIGPN